MKPNMPLTIAGMLGFVAPANVEALTGLELAAWRQRSRRAGRSLCPAAIRPRDCSASAPERGATAAVE